MVEDNAPKDAPTRIIGTGLNECVELVQQLARKDFPILLVGATGTGKELLADVYANTWCSARHVDRPSAFAKINCSGLTDELLRAELFGHERGAFTGADRKRDGYVQKYRLTCLDELGDAGAAFQAALLRVVETGQYVRVGSNEVEHSRARFIASTNRRRGIRADLAYRFFEVEVPPLAERPDDIVAMVATFGEQHGITKVTERFITWAGSYPWPGNVRELLRYVERASLTGTPDIPTSLAGGFSSRAVGRAHRDVLDTHYHLLSTPARDLVPLDEFRERFRPRLSSRLLGDLEFEESIGEQPTGYYLRTIANALSAMEHHNAASSFRDRFREHVARLNEQTVQDPEREELRRKLVEAGSVTQLAKAEKVPRTTMQGCLRRLGIDHRNELRGARRLHKRKPQ